MANIPILSNLSIPNVMLGYTTIATANGTTTLVVGSNFLQYFTGTANQNCDMPNVTTLELGQTWKIVNNSTGSVTIRTSTGVTIVVLSANETAFISCILLTGTTPSSWDYAKLLKTPVDINAAQTLASKRINPRLQSVSSASTVTPDADANDMVVITAQAVALTIANPSGTPVNGQPMIIRLKDNGTARAITWGSQYRGIGTALPSTTTISKTIYFTMIYNSADTKWDVVFNAEL